LGLEGKGLVVTDSNVGALHGEACRASLESQGYDIALCTVPAGETSKSHEQLVAIYDAALEAGLTRKSFIVALGGGVVGDLAGFAAASYLRGVPMVQVPTSLVAMVDSAVGGKTGINLPQGKNLIGAFYQPSLVLVDTDLLSTLPEREYISGLAEVIKYGIIWDDAFFQVLEARQDDMRNKSVDLVQNMVSRSCEIKAEVVRQDEREGGLRAILNFGHTLGHALEKVAGYGAYLHGEAISVGMAYAGRLSMKETGWPEPEYKRMVRLLEAVGLPVTAGETRWAPLREAMSVDKKVEGSTPRFVLAEKIGNVCFGCDVDEGSMEAAWTNAEG
jgi:3-dehydroquinate synthase